MGYLERWILDTIGQFIYVWLYRYHVLDLCLKYMIEDHVEFLLSNSPLLDDYFFVKELQENYESFIVTYNDKSNYELSYPKKRPDESHDFYEMKCLSPPFIKLYNMEIYRI